MLVLRRRDHWCCSSILPLLLNPILQRCFSNSETCKLVALWTGIDGLVICGGERSSGREGEELDESLYEILEK